MDAPMMIAALWLIVGLAAGTAHFALLRWNTALYLVGGGFARPFGLQALRLATTAGLLAFAAWHGALALLCTAAGVFLARLGVVRVVTRTPAPAVMPGAEAPPAMTGEACPGEIAGGPPSTTGCDGRSKVVDGGRSAALTPGASAPAMTRGAAVRANGSVP